MTWWRTKAYASIHSYFSLFGKEIDVHSHAKIFFYRRISNFLDYSFTSLMTESRPKMVKTYPKDDQKSILTLYNHLYPKFTNLKFSRFAVSLSYYGISFSIPNLSGDRYLNFMIGGGIELAAYTLAFVLINSFGRKGPLMMYLLLSGALCISVVCIKHYVPGMWTIDVDSQILKLRHFAESYKKQGTKQILYNETIGFVYFWTTTFVLHSPITLLHTPVSSFSWW